ncbi:MAG: shikimate kinase [Thiomargarita sp.]|nr:shikimate kinase [Thiomargarita sp.]
MNFLNNIFLVGPMGVGKTTIGRYLAYEFNNMTFIDSDQEIEKSAGAKIPIIFEFENEIGFRMREQNMIAKLTKKDHIILSTGGGAVLNPDNRNYLKTRGYVIYLHAPIKDLLMRTAHSHNNRPLLQTNNPRERLENILRKRHPLYQSVADVIIETKECSIRQVIMKITKHFKQINIFIA